jgi:hypothetical protein
MVVVSLATQKMDTPKPLVDIDGTPMPVVNWMGWFKKGETDAPVGGNASAADR